jgi:hypothetical protein
VTARGSSPTARSRRRASRRRGSSPRCTTRMASRTRRTRRSAPRTPGRTSRRATSTRCKATTPRSCSPPVSPR